MRAVLALASIVTTACSSSLELHNDPPPQCNGAFTWGSAYLQAPASVTVSVTDSALVYRFSDATNACAELNANSTTKGFEIAIDGAGAMCTACATSRCNDIYPSASFHLSLIDGTTRTTIATKGAAVVDCDSTFSTSGVARASFDLSLPDGSHTLFMATSPVCNATNECPRP